MDLSASLFWCILLGTKPTLELKLSDFGAEPEDCFLGLTLAVKPSVPDFGRFHYPLRLSVNLSFMFGCG